MTSGQPWAGSAAQKESTLPTSGNSPFIYMHHPTSWECVKMGKEWRWLPILRPLTELAGVNGCRGTTGGPDSQPAKLDALDRGNILLDPAVHDYLMRYPCKKGGYLYVDKWTKVERLGNKVIQTYDQQAFNRWRASLVKTQAIPLPHPHSLQLLINREQAGIDRWIRDQHIPEIGVRLQAQKSLVENMIKASKKLQEAA